MLHILSIQLSEETRVIINLAEFLSCSISQRYNNVVATSKTSSHYVWLAKIVDCNIPVASPQCHMSFQLKY